MAAGESVVTVEVPTNLSAALDTASVRLGCTRSEIMKAALTEWLVEEQRRHDLTLEGLKDFDKGRVISHSQVQKCASQLKAARRGGPVSNP